MLELWEMRSTLSLPLLPCPLSFRVVAPDRILHGAFNRFPDFFCTGIWNWLNNFYDFQFKWTATAAIGIYPTKAWLSQLVIFKNVSWSLEEQYAINSVLNLKKCHRHVWNASDCFWSILHESNISFWVSEEIQGRQGVCEGWWEVWEE